MFFFPLNSTTNPADRSSWNAGCSWRTGWQICTLFNNTIWTETMARMRWWDVREGWGGTDSKGSVRDLVNPTNSVHSLFLLYLSISTCFGQLRAHHQVKQLCLCDTWYLFCVDDCLVYRVRRVNTLYTRQSSTQNSKYQVSYKRSCFSW